MYLGFGLLQFIPILYCYIFERGSDYFLNFLDVSKKNVPTNFLRNGRVKLKIPEHATDHDKKALSKSHIRSCYRLGVIMLISQSVSSILYR